MEEEDGRGPKRLGIGGLYTYHTINYARSLSFIAQFNLILSLSLSLSSFDSMMLRCCRLRWPGNLARPLLARTVYTGVCVFSFLSSSHCSPRLISL